jgi:hypothetical protein
MIWMLSMLVLAAVAAGVSKLMRTAMLHGHLLVLNGPDGATRLYERNAEGRYAPLPVAQIPAALRRFTCGIPAQVKVRARNGER